MPTDRVPLKKKPPIPRQEERIEGWVRQQEALDGRREEMLAKQKTGRGDQVAVKRELLRLDRLERTLQGRISGNRGGLRLGAGAPIGVPRKITKDFRDDYLRSGRKSPIEFLLDVMNEEPRERRMDTEDPERCEKMDSYERYQWLHKDRRINAAVQVAPYMHPKLASVEIGGHLGISHEDALSELE